jgi:TRAP-type transport system small permease protein
MNQPDSILDALKAIERVVVWIESALLFALMLGMGFFVMAGIASRLLSITMPWTNEAAQLLLVWLMFVGANLGIYYREHVGVTMLPDRLHGRPRAIVLYAIQAGFIAFCLYIVWSGLLLVKMQFTMGGTTFALPIDIPRYAISLVLPVSFMGGTLHLVRELLEMNPATMPRGAGAAEAIPKDPKSMIGLS